VTTTPEAADVPDTKTVAPVYVYGVARGGSVGTLGVEGVAGRPVSTIERNGLAAVSSELAEGPLRVRRRDLLGHLAVLEAAFAQATLVPCAFGMVLGSREAVETELLAARRDELLTLLERLEGRVQLNIRGVYDEEAVLREVVESDAEIARLRKQSQALGDAAYAANIRLGELVAAALAERRAADQQRILDSLAAEAEDVVVEEAEPTVVLKASFLVSRERSEKFDAALEALAGAEAPRVTFESIGPLPPTAFAALEAAA
jgi:hypothetical protein